MFRELTYLGTSAGTPTLYRNVSSSVLTFTSGRSWMFDCGEGTQHQLLRCPTVSSGKIEKIFITHLHGDHVYGLPGLMCTISMLWAAPGIIPGATFSLKKEVGDKIISSEDENEDSTRDTDQNIGGCTTDPAPFIYDHFSKTSKYLDLYGPEGLASYLRAVFRASEANFGFQYRVHEIIYKTPDITAPVPGATIGGSISNEEERDFLPFEAPTVRIRPYDYMSGHQKEIAAFDSRSPPNGHYYKVLEGAPSPMKDGRPSTVWGAFIAHPVPSLGYVITEEDMPGTMDMDKVRALGVPKGPLLAKLKGGQDVSFAPVALEKESHVAKETCKHNEMREVMKCVKSSDVLGPATLGRTFVHLGDTCDSSNIIGLISMLRGSGECYAKGLPFGSVDFISHETTFDDKCNALAIPRGHSTARMAGRFAATIGARYLFMTHISARYLPSKLSKSLETNVGRKSQLSQQIATKPKTEEANEDDKVGGIEQLVAEAICGASDHMSSISPTDMQLDSTQQDTSTGITHVIAVEDFMTISLQRCKKDNTGTPELTISRYGIDIA